MDSRSCRHLMHLPSGKCLGCGDQHQPLGDYQPGDDETFIREHLSEEPATRTLEPLSPVTEGLVERIKQMMADRRNYFDVAGDGVDLLLGDCWTALEQQAAELTRLTADNAAKDAAIEAAFHEGRRRGVQVGSFHNPYTPEQDWLTSDSRAALQRG